AAAAVDAGEAEFLDTLKRLVADLRDGHGRVGNHHDGPPHLPAVAADWVGTDLVVTAVGEDVDGLRAGDVVTEVDGRLLNDILASLRETVSAATPQHLRDRALSEIGFGAPGSTLTLTTRSPFGQERTTTVRRNIPAWEDRTVREPRPDQGAELADGVHYVDLDRIGHVREFNRLVPKLAKADGIVFDLRGYPSFDFRPVIAHLIDETVTSAQWHVPLVHRPDRRDMQFQFSNWSVRPKSPRFTKNVAFVTDGRAISAAETLLGIVEHYKLAEIVGGPTAGTNGNINPFVLPGGYHVTWTGMRVLKHDGSQHHGVGIQPTVPVSRTVEGIAAGRDELLERAVAVVTGR
ncbi:MAG: peptidase S41, partial [Gammaproteobacteria bacterium]|nr:peptidase S41 [Gammaproteobacteria bacterium]